MTAPIATAAEKRVALASTRSPYWLATMLRACPMTMGELARPVSTTSGAAIIATREWRASAAPRMALLSVLAPRRCQASTDSPPSVPSHDATPTRWSQSIAAKIGPPPEKACPAKLIPARAAALATSTTVSRIPSTSLGSRRRRAWPTATKRVAASTNVAPTPANATRMAMAKGVQPNGAAKSSGRPPWIGRPCPLGPIAAAASVRKIARARKAPEAMRVMAPHGSAAGRSRAACAPWRITAIAGRAEASQKSAMPKSTRSRTRAAHRASTVVGSADGEAEVALPMGPGCVRVGSTRNAYWPVVTWPSVADVTRYVTV